MLIDTDIKQMALLTNPFEKQIVGGGVESIRSDVDLIRNYSYTVDHESFCDSVTEEYQKMHGRSEQVLEITADYINSHPKINDFRNELISDAWIFCQTPPFTHTLTSNICKLILNVQNGLISDLVVTDISNEDTVKLNLMKALNGIDNLIN
jgi:lipoate-protein ligase A